MTQRQLIKKGEKVFQAFAAVAMDMNESTGSIADWVDYDYPYDMDCITEYREAMGEIDRDVKELNKKIPKFLEAMMNVQAYLQELRTWRKEGKK